MRSTYQVLASRRHRDIFNIPPDLRGFREAFTRPSMRFVPAKSAKQHSALLMRCRRELLVRQRAMLANAMRGHLAEFGLIVLHGPSTNEKGSCRANTFGSW